MVHVHIYIQALEMKSIVPPRVGGTRWVGHMRRAISCCLSSYPAIVDQLSDASNGNPKAEGLVKLLTNYDTMAFMLTIQVSFILYKTVVW